LSGSLVSWVLSVNSCNIDSCLLSRGDPRTLTTGLRLHGPAGADSCPSSLPVHSAEEGYNMASKGSKTFTREEVAKVSYGMSL
jgi:hypothetical protein